MLKPAAVSKRTAEEATSDKTVAQVRIQRWRAARGDIRAARAALPATGGTVAQARDRAIITAVLALGQLVMLLIGAADDDDRQA